MTTSAPGSWRDDWATTEFEIPLDPAADNPLRARMAAALAWEGRDVYLYHVDRDARPIEPTTE